MISTGIEVEGYHIITFLSYLHETETVFFKAHFLAFPFSTMRLTSRSWNETWPNNCKPQGGSKPKTLGIQHQCGLVFWWSSRHRFDMDPGTLFHIQLARITSDTDVFTVESTTNSTARASCSPRFSSLLQLCISLAASIVLQHLAAVAFPLDKS